jgi:glycogen operon protein
LPGGAWGSKYTVVAHTGTDGELPADPVPGDGILTIPGRTVVVLAVD